MSYDLSIQSDEDFSESARFDQIEDWLLSVPGMRSNGGSGFVLDRPDENLWMELDFETSCSGGDDVLFDCVRAHIPHANLGDAPEANYFPVLIGLADRLEWECLDEQTGEPLRTE